jgi:hypothetical protein
LKGDDVKGSGQGAECRSKRVMHVLMGTIPAHFLDLFSFSAVILLTPIIPSALDPAVSPDSITFLQVEYFSNEHDRPSECFTYLETAVWSFDFGADAGK